MHEDRLFQRASLQKSLEAMKQRARNDIASLSDSAAFARDALERLGEEFQVNPVRLNVSDTQRSDCREVPVRLGHRAWEFDDQPDATRNGFEIVFMVPFEGDEALLGMWTPSGRRPDAPLATVRKGEIQLPIRLLQMDSMEQVFAKQLDMIEGVLTEQRQPIQEYNTRMRDLLPEALEQRRKKLTTMRASSEQLKFPVRQMEEPTPVTNPQYTARRKVGKTEPTIDIFVCHSSQDEPLIRALVDLFEAAIPGPLSIRCTTLPGHGLKIGADADNELRKEVLNARTFIGVVTPESLKSTYVVCELGARWGQGLHLAPLLAGVDRKNFKGPLERRHCGNCSSQDHLLQLVGELAEELGKQLESTEKYFRHVAKVIEASDMITTENASKNNPQSPQAIADKLRRLSSRERAYMAKFLKLDSQVLPFELGDGTINHLKKKGLVYCPSTVSLENDVFEFAVVDAVWDAYQEHPDLKSETMQCYDPSDRWETSWYRRAYGPRRPKPHRTDAW